MKRTVTECNELRYNIANFLHEVTNPTMAKAYGYVLNYRHKPI